MNLWRRRSDIVSSTKSGDATFFKEMIILAKPVVIVVVNLMQTMNYHLLYTQTYDLKFLMVEHYVFHVIKKQRHMVGENQRYSLLVIK